MLVLTFQARGVAYALAARDVLEVIPRVALRPVPLAPPAITGLFAYRGTIAPCVDLGVLLGDGPCPDRFGSRIMVVALPGGRRAGLLAAGVTDVEAIEGRPEVPVRVPAAPFLSGVVVQGERMVELVDPRGLISEELWALLVPEET
ncbi:MAG: chemotaxis protein CheW [Acidobacteriota bacterium]